jgi:hypothetical protein
MLNGEGMRTFFRNGRLSIKLGSCLRREGHGGAGGDRARATLGSWRPATAGLFVAGDTCLSTRKLTLGIGAPACRPARAGDQHGRGRSARKTEMTDKAASRRTC